MAIRFSNHFTSVVLSVSNSRSLRQSLADFRDCAEAEYAALLEESGSVLMETGVLPADQSAIVGALANGAFMAVRELASRLGDDCCEGLYHQGRSKHFSINPLSPVTTLITVFGNETKLGIVRSAVARYGPRLRDLLDDSTLAAPVPAVQEGDLVLSAMDAAPVQEMHSEQPVPSLSPFVFQDSAPPPPPVQEHSHFGEPEAVTFSPFLPLPPLADAESVGVIPPA